MSLTIFSCTNTNATHLYYIPIMRSFPIDDVNYMRRGRLTPRRLVLHVTTQACRNEIDHFRGALYLSNVCIDFPWSMMP
jgi:hypothetical protein